MWATSATSAGVWAAASSAPAVLTQQPATADGMTRHSPRGSATAASRRVTSTLVNISNSLYLSSLTYNLRLRGWQANEGLVVLVIASMNVVGMSN